MQAHRPEVAVDPDHRAAEMEPHAGLLGHAAISHVEAVAVHAPNGIFGEQDAVVDVVRLGTDDGEVDASVADRGEQSLDQPCAHGAVADQHHTFRHELLPRATAARACV